ncbi:hypothetical protein BJF83_06075 [Nocardiopsis sp. CNR-923]|nr:hypothetical protein BJF83_06075 [Nocardiopsis sp. CNR-923]
MGPGSGFSHAVVPVAGRTVYLAGQIASGPDGTVAADGLVAQFDLALANVLSALDAAGGSPEHLVNLAVYTTDVPGYRASAGEIGRAYRARVGRHYPAMALFGVTALFDPDAWSSWSGRGWSRRVHARRGGWGRAGDGGLV